MYSLYLPMKWYPVCITFTPTAYTTIDTIIIHNVYKPDFAVCVPFFLDRKLWPVCHQIGGRVLSCFLLGQWYDQIIMRQTYTLFIWILSQFFSLVSKILYSFFYLSLYEFLAFFLQPLKYVYLREICILKHSLQTYLLLLVWVISYRYYQD